MSFPQNPNLPKPPPKAPPSRVPGALPAPPARPAAPTSVARPATPSPAAQPAPLAPRPASPSLAPRPAPAAAASAAAPATANAAPQPAGAASAPRPKPMMDLKGLPANLGPMVEAIQIYDDLLYEENTLLRAGDAKAVSALLDRKMAATRLYQERLRTMLADTQSTRSLTTEQRSEVVSRVKALEQRAQENAILLKANMSAIEQLFEVINTAARKMRHQEVAYSRAGLVCDNYSRNGVSLAYNNTI